MTTRPIAENLFTPGPEPQLIGGRHSESGRIVFPCPDGREGALYEPVLLGRHGTLWSWTIQRFRPKTPPYAGPDRFEPFALGYVAMEGKAIVESRLTGIAFEALSIGMDLALTTLPFAQDADGTIVLTYAFEPMGAHAA